MQHVQIQFQDRFVSYDTFLTDLASRIVSQLKQAKDDPITISQNKAYQLFGRANVNRWRNQGRLRTCKRPGKVEYYMAELRRQQAVSQDYFK